jgi:TrmH family RNA methyltransferase
MISTAKSKLIRSLRQKKYRESNRLFMVEGEKMVLELIVSDAENRFKVVELYATPEWIERHDKLLRESNITYYEASRQEIRKVSNLVTPQPVLAMVSMPEIRFNAMELLNTPVLAFESIRDPGNLGTIIRTADWFGIREIICTPIPRTFSIPK